MYSKYLILSLVLFLSYTCSKSEDDTNDKLTIRSLDLSFLSKLETLNIAFYDENIQKSDVVSIAKNQGVNVVRLRVWKDPTEGNSSLEEVKVFSEKLKSNGLKVWLSLHYSDTWADPGNQSIPEAWEGISFEALKDSVYTYTQKVVTEIEPDYIQIGNEINNGFLYPFGMISTNENQFIELVSTGIQAVRDSNSNSKIIIHYAGTDGSTNFFNKLKNLDYDIIGISYYPIWHGKSLIQLEDALLSLRQNYSKDVVIAETAYPFTLDWNDWTNNIVGLDEQLILPEFPASIEGQKDFLLKIKQLALTTNSLGFCYWGPEWVAFDGPQSSTGSPWENQALFDFNNTVLPAMEAFNE